MRSVEIFSIKYPEGFKCVMCIVGNIRDVLSVENTQQFNGLHLILGGTISPMDGIGPADLEIDSLVERVEKGEISEVIMALSTTMEDDTTNFYIFRKLKDKEVKLSTLPVEFPLATNWNIPTELHWGDR
jgi:recombination protein RecR